MLGPGNTKYWQLVCKPGGNAVLMTNVGFSMRYLFYRTGIDCFVSGMGGGGGEGGGGGGGRANPNVRSREINLKCKPSHVHCWGRPLCGISVSILCYCVLWGQWRLSSFPRGNWNIRYLTNQTGEINQIAVTDQVSETDLTDRFLGQVKQIKHLTEI
jgi:hypothetical protein